MKEKELVNNINEYLLNNNYCYGNEIRMGNGIPDVMIGLSLNPSATYFDNYYHINILDNIINNDILSIDSLMDYINIPRNKVKQIINELYNLEMLECINNKLFVNQNIQLVEKGINISIEVKIKDWKNGLLQAQRYLKFSDYSYLAIKSDYVKNIDIAVAVKYGIGIISLMEDQLVEILKPRKSQKCDYIFKNMSLAQLKKSKHVQYTQTSFLSIS